MNNIANLPNVAKAKLPEIYIEATKAMEKLSRIDECKDWADKAKALASYAKQSGDQTLRKLADRIQARAINRCGELLKQIERPAQGGRPKKNGDGTDTVSRDKAAKAAGLSERQKNTALRVASVPRADFERQVESEEPPSVAKLAEQGKKSLVNLEGKKPKEFSMATQALGRLSEFAAFTKLHDPIEVARGVFPAEIKKARSHVTTIDSWLDKFITSLGD